MANDERKLVKVETEPGFTREIYDDGTQDWIFYDMPELLTEMIEQAAKEKGVSFEEEVIMRLREAMTAQSRGGNRWESS